MGQEQDDLMNERLSMLDGLCATWLTMQQTQSPEAFQGRGMVIPEGQVSVALSGQIPTEPFEGFKESFDGLRLKEKKADDRFSILMQRLKCTAFEELAVMLAFAPELNRKYERVFAYLQDNLKADRATVGLCADIYGLVEHIGNTEVFSLSDRSSALNRYVLAGDGDGLRRSLSLRETALNFLTGSEYLPGRLTSFCEVFSEKKGALPIVRKEEAGQVERIFKEYAGRICRQGAILELTGAEGSGRKFLISHASAKTGHPVLFIDSRVLALQTPEIRRSLIDDIVSWAFLNGGVPAFRHFEFADYSPADRQNLVLSILHRIDGIIPLAAVCSENILRLPGESFRLILLELPACTLTEQKALWTACLKEREFAAGSDIDVQDLVSTYSMTPGQIRQTLTAAEAEAVSTGSRSISAGNIMSGVRVMCRPRLGGLAEPLKASFTWDDLMLGKDQLRLLHELCSRIKYRFQVNEEWGFNKKLPYGRGVSVCLYGPPGTGKTMTAQVLAREFGLDAYRIDMSRILDKYIGETEKKLAELFDAARDCNAVLFFDEADALFGKRSEVSDSKDKYANAETAYLLQRMEQHNGVSILATNAVQNFDEAFKRRISFMVNIPMPDAEIRKKIWHSVFPEEAPLKGADIDFFAEKYELSGSSIKSVAVSSAFLAAAENSDITKQVIGRALKEEYLKTGRIFSEADLL